MTEVKIDRRRYESKHRDSLDFEVALSVAGDQVVSASIFDHESAWTSQQGPQQFTGFGKVASRLIHAVSAADVPPNRQ